MGLYVGRHFVSTWHRMPSLQFRSYRVGSTVVREGGNVAVYFCTPQFEVIHAVAGPVDAATFLREARWAVETWNRISAQERGSRERIARALREAHLAASVAAPQHGTSMHGFLAQRGLPTVNTIARDVFQGLLGEPVGA